MATTSRRKKNAQGHNTEEKVQQEVVLKDKKFLEAPHLLQIETSGRDVENKKLLMAVEEQNLKNLLLERQLLDAKIEKLKIVLNERAKDYSMEVEKFKQLKRSLWAMYGFKEDEGMGYNPLTGELVK